MMSVPSYKTFILPIFHYLAQQELNLAARDVYEAAARELHLTDDAKLEQLTNGGPLYKNRASWALNWLKRAGLAEAPTPGEWRLTTEGKKLADTGPMTTAELLARFSARVEIRQSRTNAGRSTPIADTTSLAARTLDGRKAYRLPSRPLAVGGQAEVYEAVRKSDNKLLIFKRTRNRFGPRMRREIEVQSALQHSNVMPILDWDRAHYSWYVMPRGARIMSDLPRPIETTLIVRIVGSVLAALDAAHSAGHPHRDVKPQNVIELDDGAGETRWVLADWGLTRRAPGTTTSNWTKTGEFLGSEGFAPPEAYRDARNVGAPGDLYAVGQLITWATGVAPIPNVSPTVAEPWRQIVHLMTHQDPDRRPQSIAEAQRLLAAICE
jgi:hypothetical protein